MSEIKIPFNKWSKERLETGMKYATSRNRKYGNEGDTFVVDGWVYLITHIIHIPLRFVAEVLYEFEGAESIEEFIEVWKSIHPKKGYIPEQMVYYHHFSVFTKKDTEG